MDELIAKAERGSARVAWELRTTPAVNHSIRLLVFLTGVRAVYLIRDSFGTLLINATAKKNVN